MACSNGLLLGMAEEKCQKLEARIKVAWTGTRTGCLQQKSETAPLCTDDNMQGICASYRSNLDHHHLGLRLPVTQSINQSISI